MLRNMHDSGADQFGNGNGNGLEQRDVVRVRVWASNCGLHRGDRVSEVK